MYLFGTGTNVKTNEDYKVVVKRRILWAIAVFVLGLATLGFEAAARIGNSIILSEHMHGVYTGIGSGFLGVSVVILVRNYRLLHNEERLKKERLKNTDERNVMIYGKALQYAGITTLICAYLAMLVAGLYSEVVFYCFYVVVTLFMLFYLLMIAILKKKM